MAQKELYVIVRAKDMANYIYTITEKSPKKFRFTLVSKLQNLCIEVIENLFRANSVYVRHAKDTCRIEKRQDYQKEAYVSLRILTYFAWMAREQQCILPKQHEQIAKQAAEVNQMLLAWARSDKKRIGNTL